jgi:hypothetical protein
MTTNTLDARLDLAPVSPLLWSSHFFESGHRARLVEIVGGDLAPPDVAAALLVLDGAIRRRGGVLWLTTLYRSWEAQEATYRKGDTAVRGGFSMHQARRAIDIDYNRVGITDAQLAAAMAEAGMTPIGGEPWHLEKLGPWAALYAARGPGEAAMAACLDIGTAYGWYDADDEAGHARTDIRALQAHCWRAGHPTGVIDGLPGPNTWAALAAAGMETDATYQQAMELRSHPYR